MNVGEGKVADLGVHVDDCAPYQKARADWAEAKVAKLEAELKEARQEAATVRRAYLHERWRAEKAIEYLLVYDRSNAEAIRAYAYKGPAEALAASSDSESADGKKGNGE